VLARRSGGRALLRIEDLDTARAVPGSDVRICEDLGWLGLDWDEPLLRQSQRGPRYERALDALAARGLLYPCDCSRSDILRVAEAPHAGEEVRYPGTCRLLDPSRPMKRAPSWRVRVPDEVASFEDVAMGPVAQNLAREVGDFVVRRADGVFAYQLAVVVDDLESGVTDVVRGADLLASTPRQIWLARMLGRDAPRYVHVPMVLGADGARLEKRRDAVSLRTLRSQGVSADRIVGRLAHGLGLAATDAPCTPTASSVACASSAISWRREPWRAPADW
jgi:glutamyl-queuosine tRNA(Asp) synthetase